MCESEYLRQASESFDNFLESKEMNEAIERVRSGYSEMTVTYSDGREMTLKEFYEKSP